MYNQDLEFMTFMIVAMLVLAGVTAILEYFVE